jgi:hypothetical protein
MSLDCALIAPDGLPHCLQARASPGAKMSKLDSSVSGRRQVSSKVKGTESLGTGGEASFVGGGWQLAAAGRHSPNSCETLASEVAATALARRFAAAKARSRTAIRDPPANLSSLSAESSCIPSEVDEDSEAEGSIASIPSSVSRGWASASDVSATSPVPTEALEALEASFERTMHKERAKLDAARRAVSGDTATPASSGTALGVEAVEPRSSAQPPSRPDSDTHDDSAVTPVELPVERGEMSTPSHKRLTSADASADHETESADQIQSADASADHETESAPPASAADNDSDSADSGSNAAILTLPMATAPLSEAERQKPRRTFTFGPGSLGMTFTEAAGRCTFITEVAAGSQAAKKGVVAGSKLVSVAGHPMEGLGSDAAVARIKEEMQRAAQQPMIMELESSAYDAPFESPAPLSEAERQKPRRTFTFGPGSLGMTFTEAAGRCTFITEVAAGSQAAKKGVVAGSKLVSVAGHPMEGLGSDAAVARIKEEMQRAAQKPMTMELESSAYDAPFQSVETTPSGSNKKASLVARAFGFGSGTKSGSKR